jgi:hypothetical protein
MRIGLLRTARSSDDCQSILSLSTPAATFNAARIVWGAFGCFSVGPDDPDREDGRLPGCGDVLVGRMRRLYTAAKPVRPSQGGYGESSHLTVAFSSSGI